MAKCNMNSFFVSFIVYHIAWKFLLVIVWFLYMANSIFVFNLTWSCVFSFWCGARNQFFGNCYARVFHLILRLLVMVDNIWKTLGKLRNPSGQSRDGVWWCSSTENNTLCGPDSPLSRSAMFTLVMIISVRLSIFVFPNFFILFEVEHGFYPQ